RILLQTAHEVVCMSNKILPPGSAGSTNSTAAPAADISLSSAVHAAALEFDRAWAAGTPPEIAAFVPPAGPARSAMLLELALIDLERRLKLGLAATAADYLDRFPELADDSAAAKRLREIEAAHIDPSLESRTQSATVPRSPA